jgi:hypothetical protein
MRGTVALIQKATNSDYYFRHLTTIDRPQILVVSVSICNFAGIAIAYPNFGAICDI